MGGELLERILPEQSALAMVGEREQLLAAWLVTLRSARTRRAYAPDYLAWLA